MYSTQTISPRSEKAAPSASAVLSAAEPLKQDEQLLQPMPIQCSLSVGAADDPLEDEADQMADTVMRMPMNMPGDYSQGNTTIQRKCAHCEEEEKETLQRKPLSASITPFIQTKSNGEGNTSSALTNQINNNRGGGTSMDGGTRSFMETRFGSDFSNVKIHTGNESVQMSRELSAKAFTVGNDIYFNEGQYNPGSNSGKHLLAHELTHTIQQGAASKIQKRGFSTADDIHDPLLDSFSEETGTPRETANAYSPEYEAWLASHHTTPVVPPAAPPIAPILHSSCNGNTQMVTRTVNDALLWIDDIYDQLVIFATEQIFDTPGTTPSADHTRIASALQQTFHTTDEIYVQVLASRFYHIGRMLREPRRVTIFCGGAGCAGGGSSITSAYVDMPYQIHICGGGGGSTATFIHEMAHAVVPRVGIRNTVTQNTGITDRAYDHERVFHHLSPEEALDNAESYGLLADALRARTTGNIVRPQADSTTGCSSPDDVLSAFARAEQWTRRSWQLIGQWVRDLHGQAPSTLTQPDLDFFNAHLSYITTNAQLVALYNSLTSVYTSAYSGGSGHAFKCLAANAGACNGGVVGIAANGTATATAVHLGAQSATSTADLCSNWFAQSGTDRIRSIFVLFLLARPAWVVAGINMANAYQLADFAKAVMDETLPPPVTTDAVEHMFRDAPTAPVPAP